MKPILLILVSLFIHCTVRAESLYGLYRDRYSVGQDGSVAIRYMAREPSCKHYKVYSYQEVRYAPPRSQQPPKHYANGSIFGLIGRRARGELRASERVVIIRDNRSDEQLRRIYGEHAEIVIREDR